MSLRDRRSRLVLPKLDYKKLTTQVHQRDNWKCRAPYCGARTISAHHIIFRSQTIRFAGIEYHGDDASWNLISLCNRCHEAVHQRFLIILPLHEGTVISADEGVKWLFVGGFHPRIAQDQSGFMTSHLK